MCMCVRVCMYMLAFVGVTACVSTCVCAVVMCKYRHVRAAMCLRVCGVCD